MVEVFQEQISETEYLTWVTPLHACQMLRHMDVTFAREAILKRVLTGRIRTAAEEVLIVSGQSETRLLYRVIDRMFWTQTPRGDMFWSSGDIQFNQVDELDRFTIDECSGVRFEFAGVAKLVHHDRPLSVEAPELVRDEERRGPKPKAFWEPMWAGILAQFASPELLTLKQSEIETVINDWLSENDVEAGESTVRLRAQMLIQALKAKAGNSSI